jgi:hypothetical protein
MIMGISILTYNGCDIASPSVRSPKWPSPGWGKDNWATGLVWNTASHAFHQIQFPDQLIISIQQKY